MKKKPPVTLYCAACGKPFEVIPSRAKRRKTCSVACLRALSRPVEVACVVCGKKFLVKPSHVSLRKTCSRKCQARLFRRPSNRACAYCEQPFRVAPHEMEKRRFCSRECYLSAMAESRSPAGSRDEWENRQERKTWRAAVLERDGHKCQKCGATKPLEAHHIMPYSVRPDMAGDVSNGITLCRLCHNVERTMEWRVRPWLDVEPVALETGVRRTTIER